jgi:hypothetical protein
LSFLALLANMGAVVVQRRPMLTKMASEATKVGHKSDHRRPEFAKMRPKVSPNRVVGQKSDQRRPKFVKMPPKVSRNYVEDQSWSKCVPKSAEMVSKAGVDATIYVCPGGHVTICIWNLASIIAHM